MSRLLFAAARGARIQTEYHYPKKYWGNVIGIRTDDFFPYRIHPKDEALQYGPVSTALREAATTDYQPTEYVMAALSIANYIQPQWSYRWETELHRSLFLLLLSESLADSGL